MADADTDLESSVKKKYNVFLARLDLLRCCYTEQVWTYYC